MLRALVFRLAAVVLAVVKLADGQISGPPTANCHITDGIFTPCQNGQTEWSDVKPLAFPATNSYLYVNQDATHTYLYLMYDFPFRTTPIVSTDSVHIGFDTVSQDSGVPGLEEYDIYIFGNGQIQVLEQGQPTPQGRITGAAGFGVSPNSATPHLMAELRVPLTPGPPTAYSPDPLFWTAAVSPTPPPPSPPSCPPLANCNKTTEQIAAWEQEAAADEQKADALLSLTQAKANADLHNASGACLVPVSAVIAALVVDGVSALPAEQAEAALVAAGTNPELLVAAAGGLVALAAMNAQGRADLIMKFAAVANCVPALTTAITEEVTVLSGTNQALAALYLSEAQALQVLADDPPDPNFTVVATPVFLSLSVQPLTPEPGLTAQVVNDLNSLMSNLEQQIALLRVIPIAINRVSGAVAAGNALWQAKQAQAAQTYASQILPLLQAKSSMEATLVRDLTAGSGGGFTFSSNDVADTLSVIKQNGLPIGVTTALAQLGLSAVEQANAANTVLSTDPVLIAALGTGVCPQALSDPSFGAATNDAVNASGQLAGNVVGTSNSANCIPFGCAATTRLSTYQQVYASSVFSGVTKFNQISFFRGCPGGNLSSGTYQISFSYTSMPVGGLSTNLSANIGSGQASFGSYTLDGGLAPSTLTLTGNTFTYDPTLGNLLMTIAVSGAADSTLFGFYASEVNGGVSSRVYDGESTAEGPTSALVTEFSDVSALTPVGAAQPPVTTATAAVVQANSNGDTVVSVRGLAPTNAPTLQEQIEMIVQSRVIQNPSTSAIQLTTLLVNSLPPSILPPSQAANIITSVSNSVVLPPSPANLVVTRTLTRNGGNIVVQLTITNTGVTSAINVVLSNVKVGGASASPLPQNLGTIAVGASTQATVAVPGSVGGTGAASSLVVNGTYAGGTFTASSRITLP